MAGPPAIHRILVTVEQAAIMVSARRAEVRAELSRLGIIRLTPWGERVPVDALRAWALGLPAANAVPVPTEQQPPPRKRSLHLVAGGTLDKPRPAR